MMTAAVIVTPSAAILHTHRLTRTAPLDSVTHLPQLVLIDIA
jgi:hypothetical protein